MPREDLFTMIHKALRAMLYDLDLELQRIDFLDGPATAGLLSRIRGTIDLMNLHASQEEKHIFPDMRVPEPELAISLELDHREIERLGLVLESTAAEIEAAKDAVTLLELGKRLCWEFHTYLAFFLHHLNYEEQEAVPASQRHFSDQELRGMRGKIMAGTPPQSNAEFMKWMFDSSNVNELAESMAGIRASGMPAEALDGMFSFARSIIGEERWRIIQGKAGV